MCGVGGMCKRSRVPRMLGMFREMRHRRVWPVLLMSHLERQRVPSPLAVPLRRLTGTHATRKYRQIISKAEGIPKS